MYQSSNLRGKVPLLISLALFCVIMLSSAPFCIAEEGLKHISELRTPCYLVRPDIVQRNVQRMQQKAESLGVSLRTNTKTTKTYEGAFLATAGTKRGIAVSTLAEAEFFADRGFDDILYAFPITADKVPRARALAARLDAFHVMVDHKDQLAALLADPPEQEEGGGGPKKWSVFLMVDAGYHRDGVDPTSDAAVELTLAVLGADDRAVLAGVYTHEGQSYGAASPAELRAAAAAGRRAVVGLADQVRELMTPEQLANGPLCVGIGSTPTCSADLGPGAALPGLTEIHPGNYVYYDCMMADLGVCREEDIAVRVLGRVVGHVAATGRLRVDLGWTALSAQGAGRGYGRVLGRPELRLEALSQECGTVGPADPTRPLDLAAYPVGTLLQVLPHHACAATAAHAEARAVAPDGETLLEGGPWPIVRGW